MDVVSDDWDLLDQVITRESVERLQEAVRSALNQQERLVISMRYGLGGKNPLRQREVAERCGISRSYVSRIEKRALGKLREALEGREDSR